MRGKIGKMDDMHSHKAGIVVDPKKPGPPNKTVRCYIRRDRELSSFALWQKPPHIGWTPFCRICLQEDGLTKLLTPCSCSGSMKYVHEKCLKRWCTGKRDAISCINCLRRKPKPRTICNVCHKPYKMKAVATDGTTAEYRTSSKFLFASREVRHGKSIEIIISSNPNVSEGSDIHTVGKLKSNFQARDFTIFDNQLACTGSDTSSKKVSLEHEVADVKFQFCFKLPKSMGFSKDTTCASVIDFKKSALRPTEFSTTSCNEDDSFLFGKELRELKSTVQNYYAGQFQFTSSTKKPSVLKSQVPAWREKCTCWRSYIGYDCDVVLLRHHGKLFATAVAPSQRFSTELLRFGKVEKDLFIMDYSYPLSAFQAFAIFLSLKIWHNICVLGQEIG